jgi:hypothetical protein
MKDPSPTFPQKECTNLFRRLPILSTLFKSFFMDSDFSPVPNLVMNKDAKSSLFAEILSFVVIVSRTSNESLISDQTLLSGLLSSDIRGLPGRL